MIQNTIYTLEARNNIMLEVTQDYFGLNHHQLYVEINNLFKLLLAALKINKINYQNLKNSLIPLPKRNEAVLVFDTTKIESAWYGYDIFSKIIPLFSNQSTHSVLCGDYIGENEQQAKLHEIFSNHIELISNCNYKHSSQFFFFYINNLSDQMVTNFREGLIGFEPYVGFINLNFSSTMKGYLGSILCCSFIKNKNVIIQGHEDDVDNYENYNMCGYPFEENGYTCKSIQESLYGLFLSYKIERAVFPGFESDTLFSINALTPDVVLFDKFDIQIEVNKLEYLLNHKAGKLKKAGILHHSKNEIESLIREKINSNYIYNLCFLEKHNTIKFNILIELKASDTKEIVKVTLSLEYQADKKTLKLITLY